MRTYIRKGICLLLTFSLICSLETFAFANAMQPSIEKTPIEKIIQMGEIQGIKKVESSQELNELSELFPLELVEQVDKIDGEIVYTVKCNGDLSSKISLEPVKGGIKYNISEGNIENELIYMDNGDMYLDGEKIENTNEEAGEAELASNAIVPYASVEYTYWDKCLSGDASDYTKDMGKVSGKRISLKKSLSKIAASVVSSIIIGSIFKSTKAGGVAAGIFEALNEFALTAKNKSPAEDSVGYSKQRYWHKTKGYQVEHFCLEKQVFDLVVSSGKKGSRKRLTVYERYLPNIA